MAPGERFPVRLVDADGRAAQVVVEVGLEGFILLAADGRRALRKYPLHHISRWSMRGTSLILFTRSPVDVEDQTLTLQGDEHTIRSVLDTLTCSCMQMAEMLQSGQTSLDGALGSRQVANSLNMLLKKSKKPALLTADQVEFWHGAEKQGWMFSQGEHIRTWRKRWFVLKQGFLFRFASADVNAASKPRGIVDLSTVTDVSDGTATTGKPHSIRVSTATGHICYICDGETAQVEWVSALEGAVAKIVKLVAGVEDEPPASAAAAGRSGRSTSSWADQLEKSFTSASTSSGVGKASISGRGGAQMVTVVGYGTDARGSDRPGGGAEYVTVDYGGIAGAQAVSEPSLAAFGATSAGYQPYQPLSSAQQQQVFGPPSQQQQQQQEYAAPASAYTPYPPPQQQAGATDWGAHPAAGVGGPTLMDAVTAQLPAPPPPATPWTVHYTAEGRPYYYNTIDGATQWEAPPGMA